MAKSGKSRVSVLLLAVLAVAVSLHAAHRVSAVVDAPEAAAALKSLAKFKEGAEWTKRITDSGDLLAKWIKDKKSESSTPLPAGLFLTTVTDIKVGKQTIGNGVAIVSTTARILFLNKEAYGLIQDKLPKVGYADSQFRADQLCYAGSTAKQLLPVTLVFALNGAADTTTVNKFWYKQSDGSTCLAILPSAL